MAMLLLLALKEGSLEESLKLNNQISLCMYIRGKLKNVCSSHA